MTGKRESLQDYVRRIKAVKQLSYRKIAERSNGLIHASTVSDIVAGKYDNLNSDTVEGLAAGLDVPLNELQAVLHRQPLDEDGFRNSILHMLYEKAKTASSEDKKFIDRTIKQLLNALSESETHKAGSA